MIRRLLSLVRQRCVVCRSWPVPLGTAVCNTCAPLFSLAASRTLDVIDGPAGGHLAAYTVWPGEPVPPVLYVRRHGNGADLPEPERPDDVLPEDIGVYHLDPARQAFVWGGWLHGPSGGR
jgi:hypothetical protein